MIRAYTKLNMYVFTITTTVVYSLWNILSLLSFESSWLTLILTYIFSVGFYKVIYKIIFFLCNNIQFFRKAVLGKYYYEGVWVGFYKYKDEVHLYYEIMEQSMENFSVVGRAFKTDGEYVCSWNILEPLINIEKNQFSYFYENSEADDSNVYLGVAKGSIIYDNNKKACRLDGFAVEAEDSIKQPFISIKIDDNASKYVIKQKELLEKANDLYNNENIF